MKENGFTLVEMLVALALFAVLSASMTKGLIQFMRLNTEAELKTEATYAAQQALDHIRALNPSSLPSTGSAPDLTYVIDGRPFKARISFCTETTYCSLSSRHILVTVRYKDELLYSTETVFTELS